MIESAQSHQDNVSVGDCSVNREWLVCGEEDRHRVVSKQLNSDLSHDRHRGSWVEWLIEHSDFKVWRQDQRDESTLAAAVLAVVALSLEVDDMRISPGDAASLGKLHWSCAWNRRRWRGQSQF